MWYKCLEKNKFLMNLYNEIPELIDVRISQIKISDEGDRVTLIFDMPFFADKPPQKWLEKGFNTTIVQIDLFNIKELHIRSNGRTYKGKIEIDNETNDIIVNIIGSIEAKITAEIGLIQSIEGYCNVPNNL